MQKKLQLTVLPRQAAIEKELKTLIATALNIEEKRIYHIATERKSIDARSRFPKINLSLNIYIDEKPVQCYIEKTYPKVDSSPSALIVGSGPAGLFAALKFIEKGIKPIVLERGKEVTERKKDIAQLCRNLALNPESNYCFGEGGAGTFSDGKLYTRSTKKGDIKNILETFFFHGAQEEILYEAHPHIGTDRLNTIIKNIRHTILHSGGEIHFGEKVSDLLLNAQNEIQGVVTSDGKEWKNKIVILATGHSARDIYELLHNKRIALEAKGFAMGVRAEHPQKLIDSIQYHCKERDEYLPASTYNLVEQVDERGVYSFCMCPGGHIVPAATAADEIVVNGMSPSQRNSPFANSGIVVEIRPEDLGEWTEKYGVMGGLKFQQHIEQLAFANNGGKGQKAPAQRLGDFVKGVVSVDLPECSYLPGIISSPLHFWLPDIISKRLREGFKKFDRKMHGYLTNDAVVVGVESRTSSPIRIPRDKETLQHIEIKGLYPCGEGAGYAGGITSSAMDGENCAEKAAAQINNDK